MCYISDSGAVDFRELKKPSKYSCMTTIRAQFEDPSPLNNLPKTPGQNSYWFGFYDFVKIAKIESRNGIFSSSSFSSSLRLFIVPTISHVVSVRSSSNLANMFIISIPREEFFIVSNFPFFPILIPILHSFNQF